ncbi:TPA: BlaI/MecI/CopY family transcriptional regulator [Clostridioides difficile]|nr:BlaI/MecI/CopY family transcriptional regulator [Clostridioides difficile]
MNKNIPDAELKVMKFIWKMNKTVSSKEVILAMEKQWDWKQTTTLTLLARLVKKGFISAEKIDRYTHYTAILENESYKIDETKNFLKKVHDDSPKSMAESMVAALCDGDMLSEEKVESFKKLFSQEDDE